MYLNILGSRNNITYHSYLPVCYRAPPSHQELGSQEQPPPANLRRAKLLCRHQGRKFSFCCIELKPNNISLNFTNMKDIWDRKQFWIEGQSPEDWEGLLWSHLTSRRATTTTLLADRKALFAFLSLILIKFTQYDYWHLDVAHRQESFSLLSTCSLLSSLSFLSFLRANFKH